MPEIYLHARQLESVFELLGTKENSITFSVGWTLARCEGFLKNLLSMVLPKGTKYSLSELRVSLQEHKKDHGITDIEIRGADIHLIIEAKRGWSLPTGAQLKRYLPRLGRTPSDCRMIITMSECSNDYAQLHLPKAVAGVTVQHVSWRDVERLCDVQRASYADRRLLAELRAYLRRIVSMQNQESNWVYVLALSRKVWAPGLTFIYVVEKRRRYFHPFGSGGWPVEAPNYLGFRYNGRLQRICHVESAEVITNFHPHFPEQKDEEAGPHLLYRLGSAIFPPEEVRTGRIYRSGRKWAMLDLLLTSKTIAEASTKSYKRVG